MIWQHLARIGSLGCIALALGLEPASAEPRNQISGIITDASAASVPDALVSIVNEDTGFRRTALSRGDGSFAVASLEPGLYKITVRKPGFHTMIRFGVRLTESEPARADFKLVVGSIQETITVEGSAPMLDTEDASVGTLVRREEIQNLPSNGAGLLTLLELAPGTIVTPATRSESGQFTVNGQRPNTNYFTVDGVSANTGVSGGGRPAQSTGGSLPGLTAFGSLDSAGSLEAVQEVREQTSSAVPEFGRLPGAQVSLHSRSGSNELHGSLVYGWRNQELDANDWFANRQGDPRAPLRMQDFGASLGGPIVRNRSFFFLAYQGLRLDQPFAWRAPVPSIASRSSAAAWAQPALNLFPQPNGAAFGNGLAEWTGNFSRPSRLDSGSVRFDQAITSWITAFARYSDAPSSTEFGYLPVNFLEIHPRSFTGGVNLRAHGGLIFDFRINASNTASDSIWRHVEPQPSPDCSLQPVTSFGEPGSPGACDSLVRLSIAGAGQVVSGPEGLRRQSQFEVGETGSWDRGSHAVRFGGDYRRLTPVRRDASGALNILASNVSDFVDASNLWFGRSPLQTTSGMLEEISAFAQDTWRIARRLTVTYGLRWEVSLAPVGPSFLGPTPDRGSNPVQQPVWKSSYLNFAPRIGLAWRVTPSGRTVIRAGGGLYFDSSLSLATDLVNNGPLSVSEFTSARNLFVHTALTFGFAPDLGLPRVGQWNVSIEHALTSQDVLSVGYAGAIGRDLIRREVGGPGSTETSWLGIATNHGASDYHSLQAQYRRRFARGFQAQASYAWSHSVDNSSTDSGLYWAGPTVNLNRERAASDFDVRHVFTAGVTYQLPAARRSRLLRGWALDGLFRARTGFPINVLDAEQYIGVGFENVFRPDSVAGQPLWISDSTAPGGTRINPAAFHAAPTGMQGNLGRNALAGFGMAQMDLALRREFFVTERRSLQFRMEAFNLTNHPNFADPVRFLASPLFGQSSSMLNLMLGTGSPGSGLAPVFQAGGPRSLRAVVRFTF